jgi:hypothetical protein
MSDLYRIYRKVVPVAMGWEVSDTLYALVTDSSIKRWEIIKTMSIGYKSVVAAVVEGSYFVPYEKDAYDLTDGLEALQALNRQNQNPYA